MLSRVLPLEVSWCILMQTVLIITVYMQIGGLWVLNNDSGRSACYDSLCINTSKLMTRFHDFPMPEHYPMYCTHQQVSPQRTLPAAPLGTALAIAVRMRMPLNCMQDLSDSCFYSPKDRLTSRMMQILEYLEAYMQHFGFGKSIMFRTEVLSVVPSPQGRFTVSTKVNGFSATRSPADNNSCLQCVTVSFRTVTLTPRL